MKLFDEELVYERGAAYVGGTRISARVVFSFLRQSLVRSMSDASEVGRPGHLERYTINSGGVKALRDHWGID
jgi:hypothetical protein